MNPFIAPVTLSKAHRLINHGPTVLVSAQHDGIKDVMAAAWACPLDYTPPKLTVVMDKMTKTREIVEKSGFFAIQIPTFAQRNLTHQVGTKSLHNEPGKLIHPDIALFQLGGFELPFVSGCSGWLACKLIPELHNQETHDLFIGEIVGAWADTRIFKDDRWHFESAPPSWRSLHYIAGGHFYAIGEAVDVGGDEMP